MTIVPAVAYEILSVMLAEEMGLLGSDQIDSVSGEAVTA